MAVPENIEQLLVRNPVRVIFNLYRLGMVTKAVVGGIACAPSGIADSRSYDAG